LAEALGDLPLALEQAGAYIESRKKTFQTYLELLNNYYVHDTMLIQRWSWTKSIPELWTAWIGTDISWSSTTSIDRRATESSRNSYSRHQAPGGALRFDDRDGEGSKV
jgi:hypothetical protein